MKALMNNGKPRKRVPASIVPAVATAVGVVVLLGASAQDAPRPPAASPVEDDRCSTFAGMMKDHWPDPTTRIIGAAFVPAGIVPAPDPRGFRYNPAAVLKAHCDIRAIIAERKGIDGQNYAIKFHLRLPLDWNGRFLFQGGGGTNGDVGNALGAVGGVGLATPALSNGYAVVSQDSGHDNAVNTDPVKGGQAAFGYDPEARQNYGYASLKAVTVAAKAAIGAFYHRGPRYSYFAGCSKGGQEGLAIAHRYPKDFNGIVAAAPGMSLPRAAIAQAWDAAIFARLVPADATGVHSLQRVPETFSSGDLDLLRGAVLHACDAADGAIDGIVSRYGQCSTAKVLPRLRQLSCNGEKTAQCLSAAQVDALAQSLRGPRKKDGTALYTSFPWDAGIGQPGWAVWKIGLAREGVPPLSVVVGGSALSTIFQSPPTAPPADPQGMLQQQLAYDFDRDSDAIYRTAGPFTESGWNIMSARSPNIDRFRAAGGKLVVPHGASDPVFSLNDTLQWYREVDARYHGAAANTVRVFPVPGMNHCEGGPATDQYDAFDALVAWVERGRAPELLHGTAGPMSPWPGRTRPICKFPEYARYRGGGSLEDAESFVCVR